MKRWLKCAGWTAVLALTEAVAAEPFSRAVSPADYAAAGLGKLTPGELARLDALVQEFQRREIARGPRPVEAPAVASNPATKAAGSEVRDRPKAKVVLASGTEVEFAAVESRISGSFDGWEPRTVFALENGQRWRVAGGDTYATSPSASPAVKITPGALGSFWMTIDGVRRRVKVVRVDGAK